MQVSSGRLTWIKVVLVVGMLVGAFWGIGNLVFPETMHEATAPEGEPYTSTHNSMMMTIGAFALTWAVAAAIALGKPLGNLGLLQAITAALLVLGLVGFYTDLVVSERTTAFTLGTDILLLALGVALWVLYPWGRKSS